MLSVSDTGRFKLEDQYSLEKRTKNVIPVCHLQYPFEALLPKVWGLRLRLYYPQKGVYGSLSLRSESP